MDSSTGPPCSGSAFLQRNDAPVGSRLTTGVPGCHKEYGSDAAGGRAIGASPWDASALVGRFRGSDRIDSLVQSSALVRASRRTATGEVVPPAILRDARQEARSSG